MRDGDATVSAAAPALGAMAGLVGVASMVPYLRDMLRGATRPHRGAWLIWGVLGVVVCESQRAEGATWSLVMSEAQIALNLLVIVLAVRLGTGGMSASETGLLALAAGGVAGWFVVGEPMVAVACVVAADLVAALMMLPKTWRAPHSETASTFALASLAGALALASVGGLDPRLMLYPLYFCAVNGALALVIRHRRRASGRGLEAALERGEVLAVGAADGGRHDRGEQAREPARLAAVAQGHAGRAAGGVAPLVGRLHREGPVGRAHHQAPAGLVLDYLVDVLEAPAQEARDERRPGADPERRRRARLGRVDVRVPLGRGGGVGRVGGDLLAGPRDDRLGADVDGHVWPSVSGSAAVALVGHQRPGAGRAAVDRAEGARLRRLEEAHA